MTAPDVDLGNHALAETMRQMFSDGPRDPLMLEITAGETYIYDLNMNYYMQIDFAVRRKPT